MLQFVLVYFHLLIDVLHVQDVHFLLVNEQLLQVIHLIDHLKNIQEKFEFSKIFFTYEVVQVIDYIDPWLYYQLVFDRSNHHIKFNI